MDVVESLDNFVKRTLAVVPGIWHKLAYLAALRKDSGEYEHWGLSKRYGKEATRSALGAAHSEVFVDVLRKPVATLMEEVTENAVEQNLPEEEYVEELWLSRRPMLPSHLAGGSQKHFELTLKTLRSLIQWRLSRRQDEPPPPPPDR
ncbi:MAG: hypothetical protein JWO20_659 [Candidatus Angelobacter sp.]|jgi:hypothetical protein|nr:hypothetical protein [Candidatus Angelobacter sp.]